MGKKYTISTHNGKEFSLAHNRREEHVVSREKHIKADGFKEIIIDDGKLRDTYKKLFEDAVREYNAEQRKQNRATRCIYDYYKKIQDEKKKSLAYEMIVAVGSKDNALPLEMSYKILKSFLDAFLRKYKSLHVTQAVIHGDEEGVMHMHITYIPMGHYSKGLKVRNSLSKALKECGFGGNTTHDNPVIRFCKDANKTLESICNQYGVEVEHPTAEKRKHLETAEYKATERIKELEQNKKDLEEVCKALEDGNIDVALELIQYYQNRQMELGIEK